MTRQWRTNGAGMAQISAEQGAGAPLRHSPSLKAGGNGGMNGAAPGPLPANGAENGARMAQIDARRHAALDVAMATTTLADAAREAMGRTPPGPDREYLEARRDALHRIADRLIAEARR